MASNSILNIIDEDGRMRRSAQRRRVMLVAKLVSPSSTFDIRIRDVSATGARIEGRALPVQGSDVVLTRGLFSVFGRLVWANGSAGGIAFEEARDEAQLFSDLNEMQRTNAEPEACKRPGFGHRAAHPPLSNGRGWISAESVAGNA